jgi:myo-inositol-1(or 4)-monophosphatase
LVSGTAVDMPPAGFVVSLCKEAGQLCLDRLGGSLGVRQKSEVDLVTEVDLALENLIGESITRRFPEHAIVSEEGWQEETAPQTDCVWLVDPLDGTTNYVHGYPMFCTSVALAHRGEVLLGCVFDPLHDELFYAEKGKGATLNGTRVRVSGADSLISSLLSTGFPYDRMRVPENNAVQLGKLINKIQGVRRSGSLALDLAYVAAGRLDGHWEFRVKPWDTAAGGLLVKEAGGRVSGGVGDTWSPFDSDIVATNGRIHDELLAVLGQDM